MCTVYVQVVTGPEVVGSLETGVTGGWDLPKACAGNQRVSSVSPAKPSFLPLNHVWKDLVHMHIVLRVRCFKRKYTKRIFFK